MEEAKEERGEDTREEGEEEEAGDSPQARPFLKRKSQPIKFKKLNWNKVKRRIDCWSGPGRKSQEEAAPEAVR